MRSFQNLKAIYEEFLLNSSQYTIVKSQFRFDNGHDMNEQVERPFQHARIELPFCSASNLIMYFYPVRRICVAEDIE